MNVTGASVGVKNNTTGNVTSTETGPGGTASASLTVVAVPVTLPATEVGRGIATLNGSVNPNGQTTDASFEWGTDAALTVFNSTSPQPIGSGVSPVAVTAPLSGLTPATTYYFRAVASTSATKGDILSFRTRPVTQIFITENFPSRDESVRAMAF